MNDACDEELRQAQQLPIVESGQKSLVSNTDQSRIIQSGTTKSYSATPAGTIEKETVRVNELEFEEVKIQVNQIDFEEEDDCSRSRSLSESQEDSQTGEQTGEQALTNL